MNSVPAVSGYELPVHAYAALEAAGDGVLVVEARGRETRIVWASEAFREHFGQGAVLEAPPRFVEFPGEACTLDERLADPQCCLPARAAVLVHGADLRPREAVLVMRELSRVDGVRRVVCTFANSPDLRNLVEALPLGDQRFRAVLDHLLDVVSIVNPTGVIQYQSAAVSSVSRYAATERVGRAMWELIHPDDQPGTRSWLSALAAMPPNSRADCEYRIRRRDGQWRWLRVRGMNFLSDPRVRGLMLQLTDCTDQRVAELRLDQVQESLQLAAGGARIGFWEYTPQTSRFVASGEYHRLRDGASTAGAFAQSAYWDSIHPDDVDATRAKLARVLNGETDAWDCEYRLKTTDGWIWVEQRGRVVAEDSDGQPARLAGILFDVNRRKGAEEALRATEQRLELAANAAQAHIYEHDCNTGGVIRWRGVKDLLERDDASLGPTADGWYALVHPDDRAYASDLTRWPCNAMGIMEAYYRIRHADGQYRDVWERAVRVPSQGPNDNRLLGIVVDVSAQRRTERMLAAAESAARVGSWEFDVATRQILWSAETYRLHGVTPEEYTPTEETYGRFIGEAARAQLWAHNTTCIVEGGSYELDVQITTAAGRRLWVRMVAMAEVVDGRTARLFGAMQDIDALKRRGVRLQRQSHWLTLALATNALSTWRWYPDTDAFVLDHRSEDYLAHLPARRPLSEWLALFDAKDQARLRDALQVGAAGSGIVDIECDFQAPSGWRCLAIRADRVISPDGMVMIGTLRDVTAARAAERHLRTQAQVLAEMGEGVCVAGSDGAIRLTNPAFDRMFHLSDGSPVGLRLADLLPLAEGAKIVSDLEVERPDGTRFFAAVTVSPLVASGEGYRVYIVRDISDRKELQGELLETANREQRRIGSDLHDGLGQELTGIALLLRGIEGRVARGAPVDAADIGEIVRLVNQAIQSTRSLARGLSPVEVERGGLAYALRALAARARDLYSLDVRFQHRATGPLTLDAATKTHLYRIAQEALTNAARHANAQGVAIRLRVLGQRVSLSIEDDGIGLPPDRDAGMGLKIMHYRAEIIGATLRISAGRSSGTKIHCSLQQPLAAPDGGEVRSAPGGAG